MKQYILGIAAVALAIAFSAFTKVKTMNNNNQRLNTAFVFTGSSADDYGNPQSWEIWDEVTPCTGGSHVCVARANDANITTPSQFATQIQLAGGLESDVKEVAEIIDENKALTESSQ